MNIHKDNRGSAIITVLVAVALMSVLGSILLYSSYTGFQMKVTERGSKMNFYDADAAVNEIRVGLQEAVSSAIASANTKVLENYNSAASSSESEDAFRQAFKDEMLKWKTPITAERLLYDSLTLTDPIYTGPCYESGLLVEFVSASAQPYVTVSSSFSPSGKGKLEVTSEALILRAITVNYAKYGYESNITTDIYITIPNFTYSLSNLVLTAIQDYVIVADTAMQQSYGGDIYLAGNVYAGNVSITNAGNSLKVGNDAFGTYTFISNGPVSVNNSSKLEVTRNSALWAERVEVGSNSYVSLLGDTYVADDLDLRGNRAEATLTGRYFGFGKSATDATHSSSILINGKNTRLNISSELRTLMLAGYGFIGSGSITSGIGRPNADIITGESISPKSNQLAYLIPAELINSVPTNPMIYTGSVPSSDTLRGYVNTSLPLWDGGGSLASYGANVQLVYSPLTVSGQTLVYFYMQFSSAANASSYFRDYFSVNSDRIEQYMTQYSDVLGIPASSDLLLSGNAVYYDSSGNISLISPTSSGFSDAITRLETMYNNLRMTLSANNPGSGSVFTNLVDMSAVASLPSTTYFYQGGIVADENVVGIITKDTAVTTNGILSTYPNTKVVVTTGNVTVDRQFNGLIIAQGIVTLGNSIYLDKDAVSSALQSFDTGMNKMLDYLLISSGSGSASSGVDVTWDMDILVGYDNWRKH